MTNSRRRPNKKRRRDYVDIIDYIDETSKKTDGFVKFMNSAAAFALFVRIFLSGDTAPAVLYFIAPILRL